LGRRRSSHCTGPTQRCRQARQTGPCPAGPLAKQGAGPAEAQNLGVRRNVQFTRAMGCGGERLPAGAGNLDAQNVGATTCGWAGRWERGQPGSFLNAYSLREQRVRVEFEERCGCIRAMLKRLRSWGTFIKRRRGVVGGGLDKAEGVAAQWRRWTRPGRTSCEGSPPAHRSSQAPPGHRRCRTITVH